MRHAPDISWVNGEIDFHTKYTGVFEEEQNKDTVLGLRDRLRREHYPVVIQLQPGDATKYKFLLVPEPQTFEISDDGRMPGMSGLPMRTMFITVLEGLGSGCVTVNTANDLEGIRYRIADKMDIPNVCTAEALARTVQALWCDAPPVSQ